jgi:hypothetical protein
MARSSTSVFCCYYEWMIDRVFIFFIDLGIHMAYSRYTFVQSLNIEKHLLFVRFILLII